jgi:hypothetical protein
LAVEADAVAARYRAGDSCAAREEALRLQRETTRAINAGRVPTAFQEDLQSAANSLVDRISCVTPRIPPPPPQPPGKAKGHEKKHEKKHQGEGDGD